MITKLLTKYNSFALWARIVIAIAIGLLVIGVAIRFSSGLHQMIFGNTEAKREHANAVVAEEQGQASKETGIEATNTVVHTYERHVEVDHIVKEGQNEVARADHGEQMAPDLDAAGAAALCKLHHDLCRPDQH